MKRKATTLFLALAMMLGLLSACDGLTIVSPTRGGWDGYVFTSEHLGFHFVLPPHWTASTDAEIALALGMQAVILENAEIELPEGQDSFVDMMANSLDGTNLNLRYNRVGRGRVPSVDEILAEMTEESAVSGIRVDTGERGTVTIGAYEWEFFDLEFDVMGMIEYSRQFINIRNGYMRQIVIASLHPLDNIDDILSWFVGLNEPLPERPAIEHAEILLGVWAWDEDGSYTYVFNADGTGTRGFANEMLESFEWYTQGDDHLVMDVLFSTESWTFAIVNDVLTIDSRQVPGLTWNYVRVEHLPALVGTWTWDMDAGYTYTFYADGQGVRGFAGDTETFTWYTAGSDNLVIDVATGTESWAFIIIDDVLTVDSLQIPGLTWSYVRVD